MSVQKIIQSTDLDGVSVKVNTSNKVIAVQPVVTQGNTTGKLSATIIDANTVATNIYESIVTMAKNGENTVRLVNENLVNNDVPVIESLSLAVDPTAKTLKVTVNGVDSSAIDISALYADIKVQSFVYDQATYVLTLTDNNSQVFTIDLSTLVSVNTVNTNTIKLSGNGSSASPLQGLLKVSPTTTGNLLGATTDGIFATVTAGDGLEGDATSTTPVKVKKDTSVSGNLVNVTPAGVSVNPVDIAALAVVDVQDLAGNHLYYAFA